MKRLAIAGAPALIVLALLISSVLAQGGGAFDLIRWRAAGGGGASSDGRFTLGGTIGQHDAGQARGGSYTLRGGFRGGLSARSMPFPGAFLPIISYPSSPTPIPTPTPIPLAACPENEPNDTPNSASPAPIPGQACKGTFVNDGDGEQWDLYKLTLATGQTIEIELTDIPAGSNYKLRLYDRRLRTNPGIVPLCSSENPDNQNERAVCKIVRSEEHYVAIGLEPGSAPNTYRLLIHPPQ